MVNGGLVNGGLEPERAPTLDDVAAASGVSRATVSRVVRNVRNVDPELHRTVMNAVQAVGYVPNRAARSLATGRAGSLALVVSEAVDRRASDPFLSRLFTDPFFGRVYTGLLEVLQPLHVQLSLSSVGSEPTVDAFLGGLLARQVDGALVISLHPDDQLPLRLADAGLAAVLFARPREPMDLSYVDVATDKGARLAADHLVGRGCTRVGMIAGSLDMPAGIDRLRGFQRAMARHGVPEVPFEEERFTQSGGEAAATRLLGAHPDLDGLFVASDVMAQGALHVLREQGRRVPDDVAVVGFDDSSAALATRPRLTTVRQPIEEMAAEMARMVLALAGEDPPRTSSVVFRPSLVVRESA